MDHNTHRPHEQLAAPHPGHKSGEAHAGHDRHAGHSVATLVPRAWSCFNDDEPVDAIRLILLVLSFAFAFGVGWLWHFIFN